MTNPIQPTIEEQIDEIFLNVVDQIATRRITDDDITKAKQSILDLLIHARIDELKKVLRIPNDEYGNHEAQIHERIAELESQLTEGKQ